jgi:peptidoglycan/LPS O-acetylase OafA/YrhL
MSYTAGVLLLIAAVAVSVGALLQVLQYRRGVHIITRGQLILRLATAVVLLAIIGLIFFGVTNTWSGPLPEIMFWSVLTLLAILVVVLALADLRLLERQRHLAQAELYRTLEVKPAPLSRKDPD